MQYEIYEYEEVLMSFQSSDRETKVYSIVSLQKKTANKPHVNFSHFWSLASSTYCTFDLWGKPTEEWIKSWERT